MAEKILNFEKQLKKISDKNKKRWWENYVKGAKFIGVGIPEIRKLLAKWIDKEPFPEERLKLALLFFESDYSEMKLAGILFLQYYLYDKFDWKSLIKKFESLFERNLIFDWNVCDWFCVRVLGPLIEKNGLHCARAISRWHRSKNIWQARCSLVAFANLTKNKRYLPLILKSCSHLIKRKERFAKTAVGWLLREISKNDEKLVLEFVDKNKSFFSRESLRNALKYLG